jgi:hypothetical protein
MRRRDFLALLGAVSVGAAAGTFGLGYVVTYRVLGQDEVVEYLRRRFAYLTISGEDLDRFAAEFGRKYGEVSGLTLPGLNTVFLLSTDFFQNGADDSRPTRFVRLYDPQSGCPNPFAVLRSGDVG